jgi:hypothetical protein
MIAIKIHFHFVTIVSNRFVPSTLSKFARCSSCLALKFQQPFSWAIVIFWTKISNSQNFGWCLIFIYFFFHVDPIVSSLGVVAFLSSTPLVD